MPTIAICDPYDHLSPDWREAIGQLRGIDTMEFDVEAHGLLARLPQLEAVLLVHGDARSAVDTMAALLHQTDPRVRVLVVGLASARPRRMLVQAARAGAEILLQPSTAALVAAINRATVAGLRQDQRRVVWRALARVDDAGLVVLLGLATEHADPAYRVTALAESVGVTVRSLYRRAKRDGWPTPRWIVTWGRLARIALMRNTAAVGAAAARAGGFPTESSYRRDLRRVCPACAAAASRPSTEDLLRLLVDEVAGWLDRAERAGRRMHQENAARANRGRRHLVLLPTSRDG